MSIDVTQAHKIRVKDVIPYTRASLKNNDPIQQPIIVLHDIASRNDYYICGLVLLWRLLDRVSGPYYRQMCKDHLFYGPVEDFKDELQDMFDNFSRSGTFMNLTFETGSVENFMTMYGIKPMLTSNETIDSQDVNLVLDVRTGDEQDLLNYVVNIMSDNDIDMKREVIPNRKSEHKSQEARRTTYRFSAKGDIMDTVMDITINEVGTFVVTPFIRAKKMTWEASPYQYPLRMMEVAANYVTPFLVMIHDTLMKATIVLTNNQQKAQRAWKIENEKILRVMKEGERFTKTREASSRFAVWSAIGGSM